MEQSWTSFLQWAEFIASQRGYSFTREAAILDFGCGSGGTVEYLRAQGYRAYGCDIAFKHEDGVDTPGLEEQRLIRTISMQPYRIPFEKGAVDCVLSNQVLEHVRNYPETLQELGRVLKKDGFSIHVFPSRYRIIESHVFVPFSSMIQSYWWLCLWAAAGIRKRSQRTLSIREIAKQNVSYLREKTHYLPKRQILSYFRSFFEDVECVEQNFLEYTFRRHHASWIFPVFPPLSSLYSTLRSRIVFAGRPVRLE
ncbi:MAG: class I SAM-dependent methyltransferase [Desulfomonilia bacterium]